jgi:hypothetical protein
MTRHEARHCMERAVSMGCSARISAIMFGWFDYFFESDLYTHIAKDEHLDGLPYVLQYYVMTELTRELSGRNEGSGWSGARGHSGSVRPAHLTSTDIVRRQTPH